MDQTKIKDLLTTAIHASIDAGAEIIKIYNTGFDVTYKADESPLTAADTASNDAITSYLKPTGIPILSEEGKSIAYEERKDWEYMWIVDPLDGTKEFIKRNGEFTVNIALVKNGTPILGVIYIPVEKTLYFGSEQTGSYKISALNGFTSMEELTEMGIPLPEIDPEKPYTAVGSKSHMTPETEAFFDELKQAHGEIEILSRGSSLKICMVADGTADIYPRFAPTMEWDVAAGHAIALFSGAEMVHHNTGLPLTYNKADLLNPWFIVRR
ncbi:MAG: 3'(2'),5'-bisphosphate nucleotidase CysQ [Bacteroidales bacterium]|nr:3'(2'),5'-bisphosphate nucleotidase CysQ [Bacteroidales bacterium]